MKAESVRLKNVAAAVAAAISGGLFATAGVAQQQAPQQKPGAEEEVVVTGSYLARPADRPQPVTVLSNQDLTLSQRTDVGRDVQEHAAGAGHLGYRERRRKLRLADDDRQSSEAWVPRHAGALERAAPDGRRQSGPRRSRQRRYRQPRPSDHDRPHRGAHGRRLGPIRQRRRRRRRERHHAQRFPGPGGQDRGSASIADIALVRSHHRGPVRLSGGRHEHRRRIRVESSATHGRRGPLLRRPLQARARVELRESRRPSSRSAARDSLPTRFAPPTPSRADSRRDS